MTLAGSDEADNQLYVAALTASHLGDQGAWRRLSGLLARDGLLRLDRHADPAEAASALDTLRLAGDEKAVALAVRRLADDGPAEAVRTAAKQIRLGKPTRTSVFADLALLEHGGDLLDEETATAAVQWLLATLDDPADFLTLSSDRGFSLPATVAECLSGLVGVVPELGVAAAAERVPQLPEDDDVLTPEAWARVLYALPRQAWTQDAALQLLEGGVPPRESALRWPVLLIASDYDPAVRGQLVDAARAGSLDALAHLGPVAQADPELAGAVTPMLAASLGQMRDRAREGTVGIPARDPAGALATLLSQHPNAAQLGGLLDFLEDDNIPRANKRRPLQVLALGLPRFPADAHERLEAIADRIARFSSAREDPLFDQDIRGEAGALSAMLKISDRDEFAQRFNALLSGGPTQRAWAARLTAHIPGDEYVPSLAALASDENTTVRAAAAGSLARLVAAGRGGTLADSALRDASEDPGRHPPGSIARALEAAESLSPAARTLARSLQTHISAAVRESATAAVESA